MLDKYFPFYALVFFTTLILTALIEKRFIPYLKIKAQQPIYNEGPSWHQAKSGTPTMGGVAFLSASIISLLPASVILLINESFTSFISIILTIGFALGNAAIGIIDDITKLRRKKNAGLSPTQKLFLQFVICILFLTLRAWLLDTGTSLSFSFGKIELGFFFYPFSIFIMLGLINSANLTDGIDGLASSVAFAVGISLFYISASLIPELAFVSSSIVGATVGFLLFNIHPAKIFMGDAGSLLLGAIAVGCAFSLSNPLFVLIIGIVYIIEGFSVVIQVVSFKIWKKRVFKMAPLHHHLEKCGFEENKICLIAMIATLIFSLFTPLLIP